MPLMTAMMQLPIVAKADLIYTSVRMTCSCKSCSDEEHSYTREYAAHDDDCKLR